jgi:hypothetical protein
MSDTPQPAEPVFPVLLHHLSADGRTIGPEQPDVQLDAVPLTQLRVLLSGFEAALRTAPAGASPEVSFKTAREMLIVRAAADGLRLISWESPLGGSPMTAAQICDSLIRPAAPVRKPRPEQAQDDETEATVIPGWVKAAVLLVAILGLNAWTVWRLARPEAPEFLPAYELLSAAENSRVLNQAAGDYETGRRTGDRVLFLSPNGYLRLGVYGAQDEISEATVQYARAARNGERTYLVTNENVPFEVRDENTLVLFGTVYRRR